MDAAWNDFTAAVDEFKVACAEILADVVIPLPEEEQVKAEDESAKAEETMPEDEAGDAVEDPVVDDVTVEEAADDVVAEEAVTEVTGEEASASESTTDAVADDNSSDADEATSYSAESYSMVARTLSSIEFRVVNGEGSVTANEIVSKLAALLSQGVISDEEAAEQLKMVLVFALNQEDLNDAERAEALAVIGDAMVEIPADQELYTPKQLQNLYDAAEDVFAKYEAYQKASDAYYAYYETVNGRPMVATPSAIQLVLDYSNGTKVTVELERQADGTYVYEGIKLMNGESVGIDVKATTSSAINFTITETETGNAKTVDFKQGTTTVVGASVSGSVTTGQSISYTAVNTFDPKARPDESNHQLTQVQTL